MQPVNSNQHQKGKIHIIDHDSTSTKLCDFRRQGGELMQAGVWQRASHWVN